MPGYDHMRGHEAPASGRGEPELERQVLSARVPAYIVAALDRCADAQLISRSHVLRTILRRWVEGRPLPSSDAEISAEEVRGQIL